jgi:hypothetical protein
MHKWGVAACGRARHTLAMSEPAFDFTELSVPERIQLVEAELDANPEAGIPWEQVKADIERHLHQRG